MSRMDDRLRVGLSWGLAIGGAIVALGALKEGLAALSRRRARLAAADQEDQPDSPHD